LQVGAIGTGAIGLRLVEELVAAGFSVRCFDVDQRASERAAAAGAEPVSSARELSGVPLVLLALPGDREVSDALTGPSGLLSPSSAGTVIVDASTISPSSARATASVCASVDAAYLDAPVSGRPPQMAMFVGGDATALEHARPVLATVASEIHHLGASGNGAVAKLMNQFLMLTNLVAAIECVELASTCGLEARALVAAMQTGSGGSFALELVRRFVLEGAFTGNESPLALMRKDIELIDALWGRDDVPVWADVRELYAEAARRFDATDDFWSVAKVLSADLTRK
jgi:3-hydroxyisobutyrate dehydrogenase